MLSFLHDTLIVYEDGASSLEFRKSSESEYLIRNMHPPFDKKNPSIVTPPFHIHIHQTEHFRIVSGTCHLFKDTADKPWKTLSAKDPDAPKTASIPPKTYHTINNASETEPLVIDVSLTPEDVEAEERFFRNFFGYLDDCRKAGQQPSLFQMFVFLRSSDTPLALPIAPTWLGLAASQTFMHAMGFFGTWVLGYKTSYEEYYRERKTI
ncbi:hypothetical protein B0T10DRAFT_532824 [Thelonectria olida]|uniref:Cupin 2 conserved barrel domain-containing protein n=1 Tax=Thelonectria olida TaxID=1576542 RepID=A0A9P8VTQ1_9HYPO|nr:hypothetical protein B0T10DRAFT_532824 [Thelonectria olida]